MVHLRFVNKDGLFLYSGNQIVEIKADAHHSYVSEFQAFYDILDLTYFLNPMSSGKVLWDNRQAKEGGLKMVFLHTREGWRERLNWFLKYTTVVNPDTKKELTHLRDLEFEDVDSEDSDGQEAIKKNKRQIVLQWLEQIGKVGSVAAAPVVTHYFLKYINDPRMDEMFNQVEWVGKIAQPSIQVRLDEVEDEARRLRQEQLAKRL